jgi:molybdate transport system substrate-binding protein
VDGLIEQGMLLRETKQLYARGRLSLAVNRAAGVSVTDLADLALPNVKRIAIANPEHAPYGLAAKETLISAGLWEELGPKLVYGENIRQALQFVQTGNAEVGLIARSVSDVPEISYTMVAEHLHNPLIQALAVTKGSLNEAAAREFAAFAMSPEGQRILQSYGFAPTEGG